MNINLLKKLVFLSNVGTFVLLVICAVIFLFGRKSGASIKLEDTERFAVKENLESTFDINCKKIWEALGKIEASTLRAVPADKQTLSNKYKIKFILAGKDKEDMSCWIFLKARPDKGNFYSIGDELDNYILKDIIEEKNRYRVIFEQKNTKKQGELCLVLQ